MVSLLDKFPEILKYGATGLSAILFFFAYLLLKQQSQKEKSDQPILQTIETYMYASIGLAVISLVSTAIDGFTKQDQHSDTGNCVALQKALDQLVADRLEDWFIANRIETVLHETGGKGEADADRIETVLEQTKGKGTEISYRRLRKAVFLNFLAFQANDNILKSALNTLKKRGYSSINDGLIGKILAEMPELEAAKLRWLEDQAIPALQKEKIRLMPAQHAIYAVVPLPERAKILDNVEATEIVEDESLLREEVELLKKNISLRNAQP